MSDKIEQLQQALREKSPGHVPAMPKQAHQQPLILDNWSLTLPSISNTHPEPSVLQINPATPVSLASSTSPARILGNVSLTLGQVNEHFKTYFARCHQYLPFKMTTHNADAIHAKCPLLFWVICTTAASWRLRSQLAPALKSLIADIIYATSRSVEQVQALLIMAMWPFPVSTVREDVSHYYCCLATQMAHHLVRATCCGGYLADVCAQGLHRPNQTHLHEHGIEEREDARAVGEEVKTTTWLSCFIVNQKLSALRGLPPSILIDTHLVNAFENKSLDARLLRLCRIYHISMKSNLAISTNAPTPSGMLDSEQRLSAMKLWADLFWDLEQQHLQAMDMVVQIAFLSSRMQLYSFALLDDMPSSPEVRQLINNAREDASNLIELCYSQNLSVVPACVRHAMCHAAFVLIKILRSGFSADLEVIQDDIERVRQAFSTTAGSPDDTLHKACETIRRLLYVEDKKLSPPIYTRMGASLVFDLLRIYSEDKYMETSDYNPENPLIDFDALDPSFLDILV
jgi:hypothetical protein